MGSAMKASVRGGPFGTEDSMTHRELQARREVIASRLAQRERPGAHGDASVERVGRGRRPDA